MAMFRCNGGGVDLSKITFLTTSGYKKSSLSIDTSNYKVVSIHSTASYWESPNSYLRINGNIVCSNDNGIYTRNSNYGEVGRQSTICTWFNTQKLEVTNVEVLGLWSDNGAATLQVAVIPK